MLRRHIPGGVGRGTRSAGGLLAGSSIGAGQQNAHTVCVLCVCMTTAVPFGAPEGGGCMATGGCCLLPADAGKHQTGHHSCGGAGWQPTRAGDHQVQWYRAPCGVPGVWPGQLNVAWTSQPHARDASRLLFPTHYHISRAGAVCSPPPAMQHHYDALVPSAAAGPLLDQQCAVLLAALQCLAPHDNSQFGNLRGGFKVCRDVGGSCCLLPPCCQQLP